MPKYCLRCSALLTAKVVDGRERPFCEGCGRIHYLNPIPSVAAVLFQEGRVLLVKRNIEPGFGKWGLPGGFIEQGESPIDAVIREVEEETGLICQPKDLIDCIGSFETLYGSILVICYTAEILDGILSAGDDAQEVGLFEMDNLPLMAFQNHLRFLEKVVGYDLAYYEY